MTELNYEQSLSYDNHEEKIIDYTTTTVVYTSGVSDVIIGNYRLLLLSSVWGLCCLTIFGIIIIVSLVIWKRKKVRKKCHG